MAIKVAAGRYAYDETAFALVLGDGTRIGPHLLLVGWPELTDRVRISTFKHIKGARGGGIGAAQALRQGRQ